MKQPNRERKKPISEINKLQLNEEQKLAKDLIIHNQIVVITGNAGCLSKGTKVFMYDGTFKPVEEIVVGDQLMGIDSKPRNVLELKRGQEQMYWVRQIRGIDYRVNESHILSLKRVQSAKYSRKTENNKRVFDYNKEPLHYKKESTVNMSVLDYINVGNKKQYKGYISECIEFTNREVDIDPYYLGLWLGDGNKNCIREITTNDTEIINYLIDLGARKSPSKYKWILPSNLNMNNAVKKYFLVENVSKIKEKIVPEDYIFNSKENRLQLLAGILDSDGHYVIKGKYYDLTLKDKSLAENITFISRSLGYKTNFRSRIATMKRKDGTIYSCKVYRITIIPTDIIPCKIERKKNKKLSDFKNRSLTGIKIEKDIVDEYYGFTLDGDNLFMLEDLTVTHNSGKSMVCAQAGIDFLLQKMTDEILVCRATIEVGKTLGYLPGLLNEKFDPYIEGFVENLNKLYDKVKVEELVKSGKILGVPIQFIRGKTIDSYLVCEESQNLTKHEMLALLTRLGKTGKIVLNGDNAQMDITPKSGEMNGLQYVLEMSKYIPEIKVIKLQENHRSDLVGKILNYEYGK